MRTFLVSLVPACLALGLAGSCRAAEAQAVINRAIQAHGGADRIDRYQAEEKHTTGTMYRQGVGIPFTQEIFYQRPSQFKQVMTLQGTGQNVTITTILNGAKGWIHVGDKTQLLEEGLLAEAKEAAYLGRVTRLTSLKERDFDLAPLGESQVNGRKAWGVKVRSRGFRDIDLYFDQETGLLLKTQRRAMDVAAGKEFTEERLFSEYRDVSGLMSPRKILVHRDGEKFMEVEITKALFLDRLDDRLFVRP